MNGLYYIYAHDKLIDGGVSPKAHYIGTVFATSSAAALKKAKRNRDWQSVYKGFRLEHQTDFRRNPRHATIKALLRRLPSGEIQLKIPLSAKNVKAQVQAIRKALGRRVKSAVVIGGKTAMKVNPRGLGKHWSEGHGLPAGSYMKVALGGYHGGQTVTPSVGVRALKGGRVRVNLYWDDASDGSQKSGGTFSGTILDAENWLMEQGVHLGAQGIY